jgi:hypothetical protein
MAQQSLLDETAQGELSLAEWVALPEEEAGELVDGRLVEEEVPNDVADYAAFKVRFYGFVLDLDSAWAEIERFEAR